MTEISAFANGRVNLIGEHTDYNGGWVLPTAIPQRTDVRLRLRDDDRVVAKTTMRGASVAEYTLGDEKKTGDWSDYLKGATKILSSVLVEREAAPIHGFEIDFESTVPTGSGLSSSAAFEIATLKALREAFRIDLSDVELAQIGQRIENEFVGAQVGIMDQMACALARYGEALFLDTKALKYESVTIPMDVLDLVVINSGVEHNHAEGDYNARVRECQSACKQLGVSSLREVTPEMVASAEMGEIEKKRARHVATENIRVKEAVEALRTNNFVRLGQLFGESHASMRDDYQISVSQVDELVALCAMRPEVFGARLTGGGFGGSIVAIARKGCGLAMAREVVKLYGEKTGQTATILVPEV